MNSLFPPCPRIDECALVIVKIGEFWKFDDSIRSSGLLVGEAVNKMEYYLINKIKCSDPYVSLYLNIW